MESNRHNRLPSSPSDTRLTRTAAVVICAGAIGLLLWLLFRYAFGVALPFLVAYLLSRLIRPVVDSLCRRRRIPRGLVAAIAVVLITGTTVALVYSGLRRGITELTHFVESVVTDGDGMLAAVDSLADRLASATAHIPGLRHLREHEDYATLMTRLDALISTAVTRLGETLADRLPTLAMSVAARIPDVLLSLTVLLLACYYFTADNGRLRRGLAAVANRFLPHTARAAWPPIGRRLAALGRGYIRASLLLGGMTFLLGFIGLTVLRVRYAFLLALVLAVVDFLPLLGTGVILVPWAATAALLGHPGQAIGLGILWGVCTLARQITEPRLMGAGLDIHPLLSLVAMYAGLTWFGIGGMLVSPILVAAVKAVLLTPRREASKLP